MTWGEWTNSQYNTSGYFIQDDRICVTAYNTSIKNATPLDIILNNGVYLLQTGHAGGMG